MVGMPEVGQFMYDHILESRHGKPHQGRVEGDRPGPVIAGTSPGAHGAIPDHGWSRHPHDGHSRVEQRPGNAFHLAAPEPSNGALPGRLILARDIVMSEPLV